MKKLSFLLLALPLVAHAQFVGGVNLFDGGSVSGNAQTNVSSITAPASTDLTLNPGAGGNNSVNLYLPGSGPVRVGASGGSYAPVGTLVLASSTSSTGGITFGTDCLIYRNSAFGITTNSNWSFGGFLLSSSSSGGIGYTSGSGGTVIQGTSKSSGVTLNTVTGGVTLNNASLANATAVTFTVTDSSVGANDTVRVSQIDGTGTDGAYLYQTGVEAGKFKVTIYNCSGGTLSEAVQINFTLNKGSHS